MLDNRYLILKNLGGTVNTMAHLVKDVTCSETLVIKIAEKGEKEGLEQEYDFLTSFEHPNIIKPHIFVSEGLITYDDDKKELTPKTDEEAVASDNL